MIARQWETEVAEAGDGLPQPAPRLREQPSPIGQLLGQNLLDDAVSALQENLAVLQAGQERSLSTVNGALQQIGQELNQVRTALAALAEPILLASDGPAAAAPSTNPQADLERARERAAVEQRFERLERQVALLVRGMDSIDTLRHQSEVHTRALARLTDLLGEVVSARPVERLASIEQAIAALELSQRRIARAQTIGLTLLGLGLTPGIGALAWLLARGGGL